MLRMSRRLRLRQTGFGLASARLMRLGPTHFGLTSLGLAYLRDFRLTNFGRANGRVRHRSALRWSPVRPDGFPQDVHENQFNNDDGNPE